MNFTDDEYAFMKRMMPKVLKLNIPLAKILKADLNPRYTGTTEDKQKLNNYDRGFIVAQVIFLAGRAFFDANVYTGKRPSETEFLEYIRVSSQLIL